ncbi:MAG: ABC transporter ATP-binding protein [Anaerofustis stercorihominis]|nr:ABC transporter ATP-binding protein [Anaerofustis stercorihominis]
MARNNFYEHTKVPPPDNIKELPAYLGTMLGGFFSRFMYIVRLVWDTGRWILFLLTFMALFKGVTPIIGALISRELLNELQNVLNSASADISFYDSPVFFLLIFLFVYRILTQTVNNISSALNRIAGEKVVKQVKLRIMEKSKELDLASFDDPKFYEKMENANREAGSRPLSVLTQTFGIVSTVIEFISYLAVLFTAPGLALATVVIILISIPTAVINFVYRKKNFSYMRNRSKERRQMNYYADLLVNKDMIKEVRMFDLADMFIGRYLEAFDLYYKGLRNLIFGENAWHTLIGIISGITNFVFYMLIARQVFTGKIRIGDYTLYTGAIASVSACISTLINTSGTIYEGTLFIDNLISFMQRKPTVVPDVPMPEKVMEDTPHTIEFENVSFRYPGTTKNVLSDINFRINPGETIAVVGLNGAGKTTLIKLLMRLYDPTEGRILLDGKDIRDYDLKSLYHAFGIIFQDFGKYALSAEENIRLSDIHRPADPAQVREAARKSSADAYIEKLPDGYSTPLMRIFEPNGMELSIGQWQKLAIARAFYADSDILILDEPTASLDPLAEQEIFNQFDELRNDKMSIFVSHRLSSATIADRIIVLENGRIIEYGNHRELMQKGEKYYELFSTQAKRYISDDSENINS